jgi:23S rRNA pseudouridine2605 synthase
MRLNKFISHNTKHSRREADKFIEEEEVQVNGKTITNFNFDVQEHDKVWVNGRKVNQYNTKFSAVVYNKPKGELVTKSDPEGRRTIYDTLSRRYKHFMPIGRLDFASEGLLLLTDSVDVANALMNSKLERIYKIKIAGSITNQMIKAMENGMRLDDASKGAHEKSKITKMNFASFNGYKVISNKQNYSKLKVSISEGKNRELRRFFGAFDRTVMDLKRLEFGGVSLNNLPTGKNRYLSRAEYRHLKEYMKHLDDNYEFVEPKEY